MNTADIRDMSGKQGLYWGIAIPFTFVVLGLAYVYAYRWKSLDMRDAASWAARNRMFEPEGHRQKEHRARKLWRSLARLINHGQASPEADNRGHVSRTTTWMSHAP
jgi:hypothetical protein